MEKKPQVIAKEQQVDELEKLFEENEAVVLTDYRGITVDKDVKLRAKLREAGVEYRVAKNTLIKIAANKFGVDCLDKFLEGPTAIAFSKDPVAGAKVIGDFIRENKMTPSRPVCWPRSSWSPPRSTLWPNCPAAKCCCPRWPAASALPWLPSPAL